MLFSKLCAKCSKTKTQERLCLSHIKQASLCVDTEGVHQWISVLIFTHVKIVNNICRDTQIVQVPNHYPR